MSKQKTVSALTKVLLCSLGFMTFAYFIHDSFPKQGIAFGALLVPAYIMSRQFNTSNDVLCKLGMIKPVKWTMCFLLAALVMGIACAAQYRHSMFMPVLPTAIGTFALVATAIGMFEELVFRGFIQGQLAQWNRPVSIIIGAMSHTAYKSCLFLSPVTGHKMDIVFLTFWTFVVGLLFGALKDYSKSVIPPALGHGVFDFIVYGGCTTAPWWVW